MESIEFTCKQIEESLDAFHDGELPAEERAPVQAHLQSCPSCVSKLGEINRVVHALKTMPRVTLSPEASVDLDKLLERQTKIVRLRPKVWAPVAVAAAVAAIVVGFKSSGSFTASSPVTALNPNQSQSVQIASDASQRTSQRRSVATNPMLPPGTTASAVASKPPGVALPVRPDTGSAKGNLSAESLIAEKGVNHSIKSAKHGAQSATSCTASTIADAAAPSVHAKRSGLASSTSGSTMVATTPEHMPVSSESSTGGNNSPSDDTIAELPGGGNSFNDALGISTDEDGLYDIKM